ncbi:MAG: glyoxylase-like metal-dependent hydrolase (beta-lactamase superfamily II) [Arenicella sp.]|jgi:glyoxylase-like metal-dependent hydrolase (beta-lactamase superfamily II)
MTQRLLVSLLTLLAVSSNSIAGEKEDKLIEKLSEAYGGEALTSLSSYKIVDHFLAPTSGQSHSPSLMEVSSSKQVLQVDLKNNRAIYDTWNQGRSGAFQGSIISDGEKAYTINYPAGTYGDANNADPHVFAGGSMRTSGTVLAYELTKAGDKAVLKEDVSFMNRPHHVLTMPFLSSSDLNLYIDAQTSLISKMVRENPALGDLSYVYSGHTKIGELVSATSINFFIDGQPNLISTKHALTFNQPLDPSSVTLPSDLKAEGQRIDASEMVINKISDGVYHIGQNGGFSLFADTSIGTVAAGGYAGLTARLKNFAKASGRFKPLSHQIVTHHHSDHIGGLGEAVQLGARLVTVDHNVETIKQSITPEPADTVFYRSGPRTTLGDGRNRIEVYEVSTSHAASFLVMYAPAEKTVFIADHYGSPFAKGLPNASLSSVEMFNPLKNLDIDIEKIATAHNARIFSMKELTDSSGAFKEVVCSASRPVCL